MNSSSVLDSMGGHDDDRVTSDQALRCAIGITYGQVFAGTVGGSQRAEYTLHGTAVNMAARLMVKSQVISSFIFQM